MIAEKNDPLNFSAIVYSSLVLLVVMTAAGSVFWDYGVGLGIMAGGCIALVNFLWLHGILRRVLGLSLSSPTRFTLIRFILRFSLTAFALYYLLVHTTASITGLFVGLSVIVITLVSSLLVQLVRSGG